MNLRHPPDPVERFVIYLNDHRAGMVGETGLAERCRSANLGTPLGHELTAHIATIATSRDTVDELIGRCGGSVDRLKSTGASVGEKFGRFKFNGQLFGYSPLSRVLELEALTAANELRCRLWQTCGAVEHPTTSDIDAQITQSAESTNDQRAVLDRHLAEARLAAFGSGSDDGMQR